MSKLFRRANLWQLYRSLDMLLRCQWLIILRPWLHWRQIKYVMALITLLSIVGRKVLWSYAWHESRVEVQLLEASVCLGWQTLWGHKEVGRTDCFKRGCQWVVSNIQAYVYVIAEAQVALFQVLSLLLLTILDLLKKALLHLLHLQVNVEELLRHFVLPLAHIGHLLLEVAQYPSRHFHCISLSLNVDYLALDLLERLADYRELTLLFSNFLSHVFELSSKQGLVHLVVVTENAHDFLHFISHLSLDLR